ncbi:MAG: hypothetical protein ACE5G2_08770, partial [Candidatus Krumholzibacteriia bacterium]
MLQQQSPFHQSFAVHTGAMALKRRDILAHRDAQTLIASVLFVALCVVFRRFDIDDAFISYRYARHLGDGLGPVMNAGEHVEGVSNLPWTGLLGLLSAAGLEPHAAAPFLGIVCGFLAIGLVSELASRLTGDTRAGGPAALLFAAWAPIAAWSVSGMETLAYTAAITWLFLEALRDPPPAGRGTGTGLVLGLVAALRPEGLLLALPLVAAAPRPGRWHLRAGLGAAVILGPLVAFRLVYYGDWLPNPVYAKATLGTAALGSGLLYVGKMLAAFPIHFGSLLVARALLPSAAAARLLLGWVGVQVVFAFLVGGERFPGYRFLVPAWPAVAVACELGLRALRRRELRAQRPARVVALLCGVVGIVLVVTPGWIEPLAGGLLRLARTYRDAPAHAARLAAETRFLGAVLVGVSLCVWYRVLSDARLRDVQPVGGTKAARKRAHVAGRVIHESDAARRAMAGALGLGLIMTLLPAVLDPALRACRSADPAAHYGRQVGEWLRAHAAESTLVATNGAGSLPYFSELPVIDMLGLTDAHIARTRPDPSQWIGHEKGDAAYVLGRRPDIIVLGGPE